jgi:hypothetical protein
MIKMGSRLRSTLHERYHLGIIFRSIAGRITERCEQRQARRPHLSNYLMRNRIY